MPAYTGCFQPFEKAWEQVLRACSASKVLLNFFQKIAGLRGSEATEVWVPAQTSGAQAPFFGGLLGLSARSALRATPPQFALRARGRCPLPVGPSLPGWVPLFPKTKVLLNFFQKIAGLRGGAPDKLRRARNALSCVKRFFRVNCPEAARGGFLQVKKPPCTKKYQTGSKGGTHPGFRGSPRRILSGYISHFSALLSR